MPPRRNQSKVGVAGGQASADERAAYRYHPEHVTRDLARCAVDTNVYRIQDLMGTRITKTVPIRSSRYAQPRAAAAADAAAADPAVAQLTLIEIERHTGPQMQLMEYTLDVLCCNYPPDVRGKWLCMFDIDNTITMNWNASKVLSIRPLCWLLQHLMSAGFPVVLVTARTHDKDVIQYTKHCLERMGITWAKLRGLYFLPAHVAYDATLSAVAQWKHSVREELILDTREYDGCAFATGDNWFDLMPYAASVDLRALDETFGMAHLFLRHMQFADTRHMRLLQMQHKRPTRAKASKRPNETYENVADAYEASVPRTILKLPDNELHERFYDSVSIK